MSAKNSTGKGRSRGTMLSAAALLLVAAFAVAGAGAPALGASLQLNNVQVFVSTTSTLQYSYYFSAYNLTGSLVASSESSYPGAAFELPAGSYLFTVSAVDQQSYACELCAQPMTTTTETMSTITETASSGSSTRSTITETTSSGSSTQSGSAIISPYYGPSSEYGFKVLNVSSDASFTISTLNTTSYPTTAVTVRVDYANGTAAVGASVSAYVIGEWYYWWGPNSTVTMSGQTDSTGVATLVLPSAPAVISAWEWIPFNLTGGQKPSPIVVGGETLNVTAYWETTYIGLAGTGLLLPPATSVQLTLQYQQSDFWAMPTGADVASSSGAAVSNAASGVPSQTEKGSSSQYYLPSAIPSISSAKASNPSSGSADAWRSPIVEAAVVCVALVVVLGAFAVSRVRGRRSP